MGTKVCKNCGEEKPINEFRAIGSNLHDLKCRVCYYLTKHPDLKIIDDWTMDEYKIILDLIMHNKIRCINDLENILNKSLNDIVSLLSETLIIHGGNFKKQVEVKCSNCGELFFIPLNRYFRESNNIYCSKKCKDEHLKTFVGDKNPNYTSKTLKCDCCGKNFIKKISQINRSGNNFCSTKCRMDYFANVTVKTEKWIENNRKLMLNNLANGSIAKTNTSIQEKVNCVLDKLNIKYENEYLFDYYAVDNYLYEYNLVIEVCGSYWHADPRVYPLIKNDIQLKRINLDKTKCSYLQNKYNINILYLWEEDINNYQEIVANLIKLYINCKGDLLNYHSFNYDLINDRIQLKSDIIKSYMDLSEQEVQLKIDLNKIASIKDTYIIFNCDFCGELVKKGKSKYEAAKDKHFCNKKCYVNYQRLFNKEHHTKTFNCDLCGKEKTINLSQYNKNKNHFCCIECHNIFQRRNK